MGRNKWEDCGFGRNVFIWNGLLDMYDKCGQIDEAWQMSDRVVNKNVLS